jgi:hypothetical protein
MPDYSQIAKGIRIGHHYNKFSNEQKSQNELQVKRSNTVQLYSTRLGIKYICDSKTMLVERSY